MSLRGSIRSCAKNMKAMNLEQIDGFFTALVCGPEVVMPGEYLPYVWGNEKSLDGVFENLEEAQEILGLLNRHWNTIAKTLYEGGVYLPLMHEDENGSVTGNEWAKGFLRGMGLRRGSWNRLLDDEEHGGGLVPVFMLAHENDPDPLLRPPPISSRETGRHPDPSGCRRDLSLSVFSTEASGACEGLDTNFVASLLSILLLRVRLGVH